MILAAHQPNFLPYPGYFFKMYLTDVFSFSDTVSFSSSAYHNYNFFAEEGSLRKITVPVQRHSGRIADVQLDNWQHFRKKIVKRLLQNYMKAPYFELIFPAFENIFMADFHLLECLNIALILEVRRLLGINSWMVLESDLHLPQGANDQIISLCQQLSCDTYLSGDGAHVYLDRNALEENGIRLIYAQYKPINYQGGYENASIFDYLMNQGPVIPDKWKRRKECIVSDESS